MKLFAVLMVSLVASGCASQIAVQKPVEPTASEAKPPPQVWSDHRELDISEAECADKGAQILRTLGFTQVVKSRYGEYVYGNHNSIRAVIKCISVNRQTLMYSIVAGDKKEAVKRFRNEIITRYSA